MARFRPAAFPRRPKNSTIASEIHYLLSKLYYQYEVNTVMYIMTPGEKLVYNMIVLSFLGLLFWAIYYYLPKTMAMALQRIVYYSTGSQKLLQMSTVMQDAGDATAGLASSSMMSNTTAYNAF